ncbi:MAG TPA: hypothetical protein VHA33_06495 [Candidatus Angelobacter sp.]|jgi:hypothetical protein|nr:hypothetical protein [Candidatus Angelobacter sp.]
MHQKLIRSLPLTFVVIMLFGPVRNILSAQHPYDWHKAGNNTREYEVGEAQLTHPGPSRWSSALYVKSITPSPAGFGTLIQKIDADDYLGERLRMTAYVKTENVRGDGVGMWMRVDGKKQPSLSFYNMCDKPITGTTDWKKYEIVLDVPKKSEAIFYGLLLHGTGQAWLQDVKFEIADRKAPISKIPGNGCSVFRPLHRSENSWAPWVGLLAWRRLVSEGWPGAKPDPESSITTLGPLV